MPWFGTVLIFTAVSILVYLVSAFGKNVWADESYTFSLIHRSYSEIRKITAADVHPPLYYFILKTLIAPFRYSLPAARIVTFLPYVFIVFFGGWQLERLFGQKTAGVFMGLFILFPFILQYSTEIRMYTFSAAFVFVEAVFAYRCTLEDRKANWIILCLAATAAAYSHYFALVSAGIIYCLLFLERIIRRKKPAPILAAILATVVLYLPWLRCFIGQLIYKANHEYWIGNITAKTVAVYFYHLFGAEGSVVIAACFALVFLAAFLALLKGSERKHLSVGLCALAVPFGTIFVGVAASLLVRPVFVIHYALPAAPLIVFFMAMGLSSMENKRVFSLLAGVCLVAGCINLIAFSRDELSYPEMTLDRSFADAHADCDCYVFLTKSTYASAAFAYYETEKPLYGDIYADEPQANPFENQIPLERFDASEHGTVILLTDPGKPIPEEFSAYGSVAFLGRYISCDVSTDAYLLSE